MLTELEITLQDERFLTKVTCKQMLPQYEYEAATPNDTAT
jgi:hypothetical protein